MRPITIICFLILLPFISIAQYNTTVDLVFGVEERSVSNVFVGNVQGKRNFRFGANFNFRIFDNVMIKTGLRFTQIGTVTEMNNLRWPSELGPNGFEPDPSLARYIHLSSDKRYFEIPILARYVFSHEKVAVFAEFGVAPHLYYNTKITSKTNLGSTSNSVDESSMGLKRMLMSYVFSIGVNVSVSRSYQLFAQPVYRIYASEVDQFGISNNERGLGVELGVRRVLSFVKP